MMPHPQMAPGVSPESSAAEPELTLAVGLETDAGSVRELNEDYVYYVVPVEAAQKQKGALFLVADGMGGHQAGEIASRWAVERVVYEYYADQDSDPGDRLVRALKTANQVLYDHAQADPTKVGMGTTMVAAVVLGLRVYVVNVGDSRAYLINQQGIGRITEDHSWVEEQVQAGFLTREQAEKHPQRNLITRALGVKPSVDVDLFKGEIRSGDMLLLCSDGLSGSLSEQQMAAIAQAELPPKAAARLITLAKEQKAEDNLSVLIIRATAAAQPQVADEIPTQASSWGIAQEASLAGQVPAHHRGAERPAPGPTTDAGAASRWPFGATVKAWLQGSKQGLSSSAGDTPSYHRMVVRLAIVAALGFACCLAVALLGFPAVSQRLVLDPLAAPYLAPLHYEHLTPGDPRWWASYLGYTSTEEMLVANPGQFELGKPDGVEIWPAQRGVFLVGLARDYHCQEQACTFRLDMAGKPYEVNVEPQFFVEDEVSLNERQVRVFGVQEQEGAKVTARLIDQGSKTWWAWWQPAWATVYRNHDWATPVWVYSIMDRNPYSPVEAGDDVQSSSGDRLPAGDLGQGDRVLLQGKWLPGGPTDAMSFQTGSIYRFAADGYVPVSGQPSSEPQPTVTLRPTENP
jgi:serine/threonine protein phosphatase PrpC